MQSDHKFAIMVNGRDYYWYKKPLQAVEAALEFLMVGNRVQYNHALRVELNDISASQPAKKRKS